MRTSELGHWASSPFDPRRQRFDHRPPSLLTIRRSRLSGLATTALRVSWEEDGLVAGSVGTCNTIAKPLAGLG
jgi:hypothetical protein